MESPYSIAQLTGYLECLSLPSSYAKYIQSPESFPKTETALTVLFQCQITRFPYENLSVHASTTGDPPPLAAHALYEKMLGTSGGPTGRGGYCLEVNLLFYYVLLGLGFSVYVTGVRNRDRQDGVPVGNYRGWIHIVNIVQLPTGSRYLLDAAFGGDGTQEVRLIRDRLPLQTRSDQPYWIYQYRNGADMDWKALYCFSELEWFPEDFDVINRYATWDALGRGNVVVVKFMRNDGNTNMDPDPQPTESEVQIVGKLMLVNGELKQNLGGRTQVIERFDESRRTEVLRERFSMQI
ncbi:arylamine N-acetyltransferase family protein [Aspergillus tanneri]|uniref:N-terminal acetyltransferase n=1 Tax=Aspergillus tanneri TaxID=1220188 RepID=A0A5M9N1I0_9EURO|nr:N-terminal acetyltransferase [Aspergillus tanneri]KAA8651003.1 N-terminal acetyltransferase [Aspergillus tanneri]